MVPGSSSKRATDFFVIVCLTGDIAVCVTDARGLDVPITTSDNQNNSFSVNFTPEHPGVYQALVQFGGQEVPGTPFKVSL